MKILSILSTLFILSLSFTFGATEEKTGEITFKKGTLVEVALLTIQPGKESQFYEEYFSQALPLAPKYGARPIGSFMVEKRDQGNSPAQMVIFFEWESLEKKRAFEKDFDFLKIVNIRNDALSFLNTGYFQVDKDITYSLKESGTYEFAALWLDPNNAQKLEQYFQAVLPLASDPKIQFELIAQLSSLGVEDKNYHPNIIFFSEWKKGMEGRNELATRKAFKDNLHLRETASPYKDLLLIKPILN